jgi:hypothetical protein
VSVQAFDSNQNPSAVVTQRFSIDKTAPELTLATPTVISNNQGYLNKTALSSGFTVSGVTSGAEAGQAVRMVLKNASQVEVLSNLSGTVNSRGEFALALSKESLQSLADGGYTLEARVNDRAGNATTVKSLSFQVDQTAPSAPTAMALSAASDSGVSTQDNITNKSSGLQWTGRTASADAGSQVLLYNKGQLLSGVSATVGSDGSFQVSGVSLPQGTQLLTARVQDAAGNLGEALSLAPVTIDTQAPLVSRVTVPGAAVYDRGQVLTFVLQGNEVMNVTGKPRLDIGLDSLDLSSPNHRYAQYQSGSGTNQLVFTYKVASGDLDTNGITLGGLTFPSGSSITDVAGNSLANTLNNVGSLSGVKVNGAVVGSSADGYLVNVTIFSDSNRDNQISAGESVGGSIGAGVFSIPGGTGHLIMRGGEDISTGHSFEVQYEAPEGFLVINPVTTLMAEYQTFKTYNEATAEYAADAQSLSAQMIRVGLFGAHLPAQLQSDPATAADLLSDYDAFREAVATSATQAQRQSAVEYQKTAAMLAVVIDVGGQALAAADGTEGHLATETSVALMQALAQKLESIAADGLRAELQNASNLQTLMRDAAPLSGMTLSADQQQALSSVSALMAKANQLIQAVSVDTLDTARDATVLLRKIVSVQSVVQGDLLPDLKALMHFHIYSNSSLLIS